MHENEFRRRFRASLGEAPDEAGAAQRAAAALHRGAPAEEDRRHPRAFALVAAALTLLVLAGLLGPRIVRTLGTGSGGATSRAAAGPPSPTPAPTPRPASECRLPAIVTDAHAAMNPPEDAQTANLDVETAGFVELATGRFQPDPAAVQDGMPFSRMYRKDVWRPQTYDPVLRRWLPVQPNQVAPDHGSYLYVEVSPLLAAKGNDYDSSTLHVYDVRARRDRALWTYGGAVMAVWTARGIEATTIPHEAMSAPGAVYQQLRWLVDPASGAVTAEGQAPMPSPVPVAAYGVRSGGWMGTDGRGRPILIDGSRNPGAHVTYFVGGPNGRRIVIHDGVAGPGADFDPNGFTADGDRLWTANFDGTAIWLWTERDGLRRFPLSGVPQRDPYVTTRVVGRCL